MISQCQISIAYLQNWGWYDSSTYGKPVKSIFRSNVIHQACRGKYCEDGIHTHIYRQMNVMFVEHSHLCGLVVSCQSQQLLSWAQDVVLQISFHVESRVRVSHQSFEVGMNHGRFDQTSGRVSVRWSQNVSCLSKSKNNLHILFYCNKLHLLPQSCIQSFTINFHRYTISRQFQGAIFKFQVKPGCDFSRQQFENRN